MGKKRNNKIKKSLEALNTEKPHFISPKNKDVDSSKYPYFSFRYICEKDYCMKKCRYEQLKAISDKLRMLSRLEWNTIQTSPRETNGSETIPQSAVKASMPCIVENDEPMIVFRFGKAKKRNGRIVGVRRDNKFYILFIDRNFTLYDHGS